MDLNKISNFIKTKRKELGITQEELAEKLFVTEKAVSRWETGRGTPDISLLIPLSKELKVEISELLNGEDYKKKTNEVEQLIEYNEMIKSSRYNFYFKLTIIFYILSVLTFLVYLRFEYDPNIELNYFIRLFMIVIASIFIIVGNQIYSNNYVEKVENKKKIVKFSQGIVFLYYGVLLFNMVIFARYHSINNYNVIPFKSISELISSGNLYSITINIFGNLFIFMPLEYFIIQLFGINKFRWNASISFIIILGIESLQYILKIGVFDVDDLILCTLGMMLFYEFYNWFVSKRKSIDKRKA